MENIVGIKAASGDLSQIAKMMSMADGALELYSGNDDQDVYKRQLIDIIDQQVRQVLYVCRKK